MKSNIKTKVAAYARVSTLLAQDPSTQLSQIRTFTGNRELELVEEYVDHGISGAKEKRPALDKLLKDARSGKFKILVITGIDRLARDTRHLLNLINELNHYGVGIISLRENIDLTTAIGQATVAICGVFGQLEKELIRERIRNALAAKKLAAESSKSSWRCGRPIKLTIEVSQKIIEFRSNGMSIRMIAKELGIAKSSVQRVLAAVPINPSNMSAASVRKHTKALDKIA